MRSIFLPRNKKPLLILAGAVLGIALLLAGGWWYATWRGTADYRASLQSYKTTVNKTLSDAIAPLKDVTKLGDMQKGIDALAKVSTSLQTQLDAQPKLPALFGITLTSTQEQLARDDLAARLRQLKKDTDEAKAFLQYEQTVYAAMQEPTTKTGPNADQQKVLADAWATMAGKLTVMSPPAEAKDVHGKILTAVNSVQASLVALPDLFNKKDVAGFTAKQNEADAHVSELRAYGANISVLAKNHDQALARSLQSVRDVTR